jgi:integrase/recombinase XerC
VLSGVRSSNPVPAGRKVRAGERRRGLLGHLGTSRKQTGGRLVVQPRRLPESLDLGDVARFLADLRTARDRAMVLGMLLGGLRSAEVRSLRLADVDLGLRRVRVVGKGGKERIVPVDSDFFAELNRYLREERPSGCSTPQCFVVLRGPTRGQPMGEAALRRIFRTHRDLAGAPRVRPHRLRHTYGTELAAAGIDLLVLRDLMGHASPETTAGYVHLSIETLSAEYARARGSAALW